MDEHIIDKNGISVPIVLVNDMVIPDRCNMIELSNLDSFKISARVLCAPIIFRMGLILYMLGDDCLYYKLKTGDVI